MIINKNEIEAILQDLDVIAAMEKGFIAPDFIWGLTAVFFDLFVLERAFLYSGSINRIYFTVDHSLIPSLFYKKWGSTLQEWILAKTGGCPYFCWAWPICIRALFPGTW